MSVANSSWRKLNHCNVFQLLLEVMASGIIVEGGSEFAHFAVPHEILFMRAPSLLGEEEMQAEYAVDVPCPGLGRIVTANMWALFHCPSSGQWATSIDTARHCHRESVRIF